LIADSFASLTRFEGFYAAQDKSAKGQRGFLLYSPITKRYFFRVYDEEQKEFTDYKICAEDIEVEIIDDHIELYENEDEDKNRIDYSKRVLGK
jgi:hypothetical protein